MALDILNIVSKFMFPTLLIENVPQFSTVSDIGKMTRVRLKRLGYRVYDGIYDARDYGGITSRKRSYLIATLLPAPLTLPIKTPRNDIPIWEEYIEPLIKEGKLREVSHSKSIQDGIKCGRARVINRESISSPTVLKSQNRMAKDSVVIVDDIRGAIYFPNEELISKLMGISEDFSLEVSSKSIASEVQGQSIEVPLHSALLSSIKKHILDSDIMLNGRLF
jgi:DNA (cytosine-5)-methyltransferase 1